MDDTQAQLITEQFNRLKDVIDARLKKLEAQLEYHQSLENEKQSAIKNDIIQIRDLIQDHETRIRTVDKSVISLKSFATLAQAGQAALTLIAASIAAWLGGQR